MLYLADFGIAKQYHHPNTHIHIPFNVKIPLTGTPVFASLNSHMGRELSRHDNIESVVYVLIYLLRGSLPCLDVSSVDAVFQLKQRILSDELCSGLPSGLQLILEHACKLAFSQKPDYCYIQDIRATHTDANDSLFDERCTAGHPSSPLVSLPLVTPNKCVGSCKKAMSHAMVSSVRV